MNKQLDTSWDFKSSDTKTLTHCFHHYPAMMIPQVAGRLIDTYGYNSKLLFDPYCGTGTSLVEANIRDINAIGTDLNPLARIIAKSKTTVLKMQTLDLYLKEFNDYLFSYRFGTEKLKTVIVPQFKNINYWFSSPAQEKLAVIKEFIRNIQDLNIKLFFKVCFSETVRECSWTRNSEFKLYRMTEKQIENFDPDVLGIMEDKLARNKNGLKKFVETKSNGVKTRVCRFNTVNSIPNTILKENSVDIVVTSPPYGDSKTTVAYGQFSRLANQWMEYDKANILDNELMGGVKKEVKSFKSVYLNDTLNKIENKDRKRVKDVVSFFDDYEQSISNVSKVIKKGGFACYVVGNRRVKGVTIPTDLITVDFFNQNDFDHINTIVRNIPNKRMPSMNSPTNKIGKLDRTMTKESIVIMQKAN